MTLASLPDIHQRLFRTSDVLLTGAVLGGGSDALHQMVLVFTNFFSPNVFWALAERRGVVRGTTARAKKKVS